MIAALVVLAWVFLVPSGPVVRDAARQAWDRTGLSFVYGSVYTGDFDADGLPDLLFMDILNGDELKNHREVEEVVEVVTKVYLVSSRTGEELNSWVSEPGGTRYGVLRTEDWSCVHSTDDPRAMDLGECLLGQCNSHIDGTKGVTPFRIGDQEYTFAMDYGEKLEDRVLSVSDGQEVLVELDLKQESFSVPSEFLPLIRDRAPRFNTAIAPLAFLESGFFYELEDWRDGGGSVKLTEHRFAEASSSRSVRFSGDDLVTGGMEFESLAWHGLLGESPVLLLQFSLSGDHSWVEYSPFEEGWSREVARIHEVELQAFANDSTPMANRMGDRFVISHVSIQESEGFPIQVMTQIEGLEARFETLDPRLQADGIEQANEPIQPGVPIKRLGITHQAALVVEDQNGDGMEDLLVSYEVSGPKQDRVGVVLVSGATGEILPRL